MPDSPEPALPRKPLPLRRAVPALMLAAIALAGLLLLRDFDAIGALSEHRQTLIAWCESHRATAVALYMATFVMVVVLSLPGAFAMTVTGGFLFGLIPGAVLSVLSTTTGGVLVFLLARYVVGDALRAWLLARGGGLFRRIEEGLRENAVVYMLLLRLIPAVPFTVANVAPAFFGVRPRVFAITTLIGVAPGTTITAWIGAGLGEVFDRGERPTIGLVTDPYVLGPILGLIALAALPLVIRRPARRAAAVRTAAPPSPGSPPR